MKSTHTVCVAIICLVAALASVHVSAPSALSAPVLHLKFDDGTGSSTAADSSGNGLNGTLVNMNTATAWVAGVAGGALAFDGTNDYVQVLDNALLDFGANDFAVSFWVNKRANSSGFSNVWGVNKWNTGASPGTNEWTVSLSTGGNNNIPNFAIASSSTSYSVSSTTPLSLNTWAQVLAVRDNDVLKMYFNGVLQSTTTLPGSLSIDNVAGRNLRIANSAINSLYANAIFDDLQIYRNALTDGGVGIGQVAGGQIAFLFNNPGLTTADIPVAPEPGGLMLVAGTLSMLVVRRRNRSQN